ncbi:YciI family protein [uncultured Nitrospira sp.]|uniref:YciI family protein n=1 Tax=uncultured Nitrospira sp. TaxID=157176 RepID=UPI003140998F
MKYLLFCCHEEKKLDSLPKSECDALMNETWAYCEKLKKSGHLISAEPLEPIQMAMTVRVRNGEMSVTDGPFAETKEQIGGFFLIDARDINQAVQIASKFPSVRLGSMEVRPVEDMQQPGTKSESCQDV